MSRLFNGLVIFLALTAVICAEVKTDDGVLVLNDDNFDEVIGSNEYILVEFYAPWCGHCKQLAPEYSAAAKQLQSAENPIPLAKVDATEAKELSERFEIEGYPTLKFFINQVPVDFTGGRSADEIVQWVQKKSGPSATELKSEAEFKNLIGDNEVAVVFFGEIKSQEYDAYEKVTKQFDDLVFGYTALPELREQHGASEKPKIVLFKQFDEGRNDFDGEFQPDDITTFIDQNQFPTIMPFNQKTAEKIFGDNHPCLFVFVGSDESSDAARQALNDASGKLKGKIYLSMTEIDSGLGQRLAEFIGIADSELPTVRIVSPTQEEVKKFTLEGEITADNLVQFVEDFSDDKLKPIFKSEEIPENDGNAVQTIVGKNFEQVVMDSTKDVLVEFYAPWCGHCKQLTPIYESVAEKLKTASPNIVIGKIDATANEVEGVPIQGFPTIKFWPAKDKQNPIDFDGDRTEKAIIDFLKEHATAGEVKHTEL